MFKVFLSSNRTVTTQIGYKHMFLNIKFKNIFAVSTLVLYNNNFQIWHGKKFLLGGDF